MKTTVLKGHPLTEKESKEVKGGHFVSGEDPQDWKRCPVCGHIYDPTDVLEQIIYDAKTGLYGRLCLLCGGLFEES